MTEHDLLVRVANADDASALAGLRALWTGGVPNHPEFAAEMARWLKSEGERHTTWIALIAERPAGMASLFESLEFYRRAGFVVPDGGPRADRLLVRQGW